MTTMDIAERFTADTANHEMTILHDDGLYRHLRFRASWWQPPLARKQTSSMGWFDLITVPGSLLFQGDGDSFQFRRIEDMFEFFRGHRVNPHYWAEKLVSGRDQVMKYDRDIFEAEVKREFVEAVRGRIAPAGLGVDVREHLLDSEEAWSEEGARRILRDFSFYKNEGDRFGRFDYSGGSAVWVPAKAPDFEFGDTSEWQLCDYDWWFLWSLHAIVWGIAQYDSAAREAGRPDAARAQDVATVAAAGGVL